MKKVLYFTATAIFFASCGQQAANNTSQTKIDSMSEAMMRQHVIDSMNGATAANTTAAPAPVRHNHESSSYERSRSYGGNAPTNNTTPAPVTSTAPVVTNTPVQPSAADLAAQKKADHKKELKSAAEGALIGGGAGAIGGAIAGKNDKFKKQDAAIGGGVGAVLGAGAGLLIEKRKLKKDTTQH